MSHIKNLMLVLIITTGLAGLALFQNCSGGGSTTPGSSESSQLAAQNNGGGTHVGDGMLVQVNVNNIVPGVTIGFCLNMFMGQALQINNPQFWQAYYGTNTFNFGDNLLGSIQGPAPTTVYASMLTPAQGASNPYTEIDVNNSNSVFGNFMIPEGLYQRPYFQAWSQCHSGQSNNYSMIVTNPSGTFTTTMQVFLVDPGQVEITQQSGFNFDFTSLSQQLLTVKSNTELQNVLIAAGMNMP